MSDMKSGDPSKEIVNPEVKLELDALVEEYEIGLRRELDMRKSRSHKLIERKKKSFYNRLLENELEDIRRDVNQIRQEEKSLVGITFWVSLAVTVVVIVLALVMGEQLAEFADEISKFISHNLSWFYVLLASCFLIFLFYLAFGRFGNVVLGPPGERPEFSDFSWYSMLFSAGMGVGILFWGTAEPMSHFLDPPMADPGSVEAAKSAMAYTSFHWGFHAWGVYTICALGTAYYGFRKRKKYLISSSILDFTDNPTLRKVVKATVDLIAILAVVFGVSASLGLGVLQVSSGINYVFGWEVQNFTGYAVIMLIITVIFILSSSTGLEKGIKILSNANMLTAIALLLFVFFTGDALFDLKVFVDSIGQYLQRLPEFSFKVDPYEPFYERWMGDWTLSYFTWWMAWSPFVGIFIARISKGRTIKELVVGCLFVPVLFSILWFSVFGGSAIELEMFGNAGIGEKIISNVDLGTFVLFEQLPLYKVTSLVALLLLFTFLVTSADSATFVVSMMTSEGDLDPKLRLKVIWGVVLATLSLLLLAGGGLKALQAATLVFAFPFAIVLIFVARTLYFRLSIQKKSKRE